MEPGLDWSAIVVAGITLIGVLTSQYVQYTAQKRDRLNGLEESRAIAAREKQALMDRLDRIEDNQVIHNEKLDKHNGFEGRIIALEVIAEWMQKEFNEKK